MSVHLCRQDTAPFIAEHQFQPLALKGFVENKILFYCEEDFQKVDECINISMDCRANSCMGVVDQAEGFPLILTFPVSPSGRLPPGGRRKVWS